MASSSTSANVTLASLEAAVEKLKNAYENVRVRSFAVGSLDEARYFNDQMLPALKEFQAVQRNVPGSDVKVLKEYASHFALIRQIVEYFCATAYAKRCELAEVEKLASAIAEKTCY